MVQARKFGAVFTIPGEATSLTQADGYHVVGLAEGDDLIAHAVLVATGVRYRRLDIPGTDRLEGSSVYYAATEFEARLCRQDPVTVVGGGNSAGQAACFLARQSPVVNLVIRHDDLGRDMSRYLADRVEQSPRIKVWRNSEVCELIGDDALDEVLLHDLHTDEKQRVATTALFVLIGAAPTPAGSRGRSRWTRRASCSPDPPPTATTACSRPAARACSPWATYAVARSSASPPPSARARSRSARSTSSWKPRDVGEGRRLPRRHETRKEPP